MKVFFSLFFFSFLFSAMTQDLQSSNGFTLPAKGKIRVLLVFVEMKYKDMPAELQVTEWKAGELPSWKNSLFDTYFSDYPKALISRYYHEASFGKFQISADILLNPTDPSAPFLIDGSSSLNVKKVVDLISASSLTTEQNWPMDSFNYFDKSKAGISKNPPNPDKPNYDHLMIIVRNAKYPASGAGYSGGSTLVSSSGSVFESYSVFATNNVIPTRILIHEFNHLLMGGNNQHCCGGNHASSGSQYFLSLQGGWGMMGANNSSFLTCNAWDRYFLDWKPSHQSFKIAASDFNGNQISSDLKYENLKDTSYFILNDFILSGNAIRILLPGIPDSLPPQFLWIENHQTSSYNQSPFDVFQFQENDCRSKATPGLYAYIQVGHHITKGNNIYNDFADFIRFLPANGNFDFLWGDTLVRNNWCIGNGEFFPYQLLPRYQNPLSGYNEQEFIPFDNNDDGRIAENEKRQPMIRKVAGEYQNNLPFLGTEYHAFSLSGNSKISMTSNPSSNNVLTLVNDDRDIYGSSAPNHRAIFLNPISIEIIANDQIRKDQLLIRVIKHDVLLHGKQRWCAPQISLCNIDSSEIPDLILDHHSTLLLDQSLSATQINAIQSHQQNAQYPFAPPTTFILQKGSIVLMKKKSRIIVDNQSVLIVEQGAQIQMNKGAKIKTKHGGKIIYH